MDYIEREAALAAIDDIFYETDPTGEEQIGVLKCRKAICEDVPAAEMKWNFCPVCGKKLSGDGGHG